MAAPPREGDNSMRMKAMRNARAITNKYKPHQQFIGEFLREYEDPEVKHPKWGNKKYMAGLQSIVDKEKKTLEVDVADLERHANGSQEESVEDIRDKCQRQVYRYMNFFYTEALKILPERSPGVKQDDVEAWYENLAANREGESVIPPHVKAKFMIRFIPASGTDRKMRQLGAADVGALVTIDGQVMRATVVRPRVEVAGFVCTVCNTHQWKLVAGDQFQPIVECASEECKANKASGGSIRADLTSSKLVRYQEVQLQEHAHEVPTGTVPRTVKVVMLEDLTRRLVPGDRVKVTGSYLPIKYHGFKAMDKGPMQDMTLEAHYLFVDKKVETSAATPELEARINREVQENDMYERLAESLAPEIWGHDDIKKAMILLLVGGVHKRRADGMKLRGDIHMLLMGDPGVAKSQLIKQVCRVAPRAVYTSGKGSSSVGLTAAVVKDPNTGEVTLEGGALVMADKGLCAIDEFDKMDEADRTAIHEVMEQQTVSIAKNGITTSLNARACVVAAANPVYGRYNIQKSAVQNINLPDSLLSRFDLQFVLIDTINADSDLHLAQHVGHVHQYRKPPARAGPSKPPCDAAFIRAYVTRAQEYEPVIDSELSLSIVNEYANMRAVERSLGDEERQTYTSPRTLLALLRMSQARARIRLSGRVDLSDFEEACRLMRASKESCSPEPEDKKRTDTLSEVWDLVLPELEKADPGWALRVDVERVVLNRGYTVQQLNDTIEMYESLAVVEQSAERDRLRITNFAGE